MKNLLLSFFIAFPVFLFAQEFSSKGTEFWFSYMENIDLFFNGDPQFSVFISSNTSGTANVSAPATGLSLDFTYVANEVTEYILPAAIFYAIGSEDIENFGMRVTTSTPVNTFVVHYRLFFTESSIVLPHEILGSDYLISAALDEGNDASSPSSFVIIATTDNTEIEIIPSALTLGIRPADIAFSITLNEGQSYQVQSLGDLTGSSVRAINGEKIAIFGGARQANIGCGFNADNHLYDQLYPESEAGNDYALIPFKDQGSSIFRVLAIEDGTEVFVNGVLSNIIDRGEFYDISLSEPQILSAVNSVFVTQFNPSQECNQSDLGDPSMLQLCPIGYNIKSINFPNLEGFALNANMFTQRSLTLFADTDAIAAITLDGGLVDFNPYPSFPEYSFAQVALSAGAHTLNAPDGVAAHAYGFGDYDAYTYNLGFDKADVTSSSNNITFLDYQIMPNPVVDYLNIFGIEKVDYLELLDLNGRILKKIKVTSNVETLDLTDLSSGIYYLKLMVGQKYITEKVVKL